MCLGVPPGDEDQGHHDLREHDRHQEYRASRKVLLRTRDGRRQERQVGEVPETNQREQAEVSSIDVPTDKPVEKLDDKRGDWCGLVQSRAESWRGEPRPKHDVVPVRRQVEDEM
jgi:hypothetical protein